MSHFLRANRIPLRSEMLLGKVNPALDKRGSWREQGAHKGHRHARASAASGRGRGASAPAGQKRGAAQRTISMRT